jgi:hypothetical protein
MGIGATGSRFERIAINALKASAWLIYGLIVYGLGYDTYFRGRDHVSHFLYSLGPWEIAGRLLSGALIVLTILVPALSLQILGAGFLASAMNEVSGSRLFRWTWRLRWPLIILVTIVCFAIGLRSSSLTGGDAPSWF